MEAVEGGCLGGEEEGGGRGGCVGEEEDGGRGGCVGGGVKDSGESVLVWKSCSISSTAL